MRFSPAFWICPKLHGRNDGRMYGNDLCLYLRFKIFNVLWYCKLFYLENHVAHQQFMTHSVLIFFPVAKSFASIRRPKIRFIVPLQAEMGSWTAIPLFMTSCSLSWMSTDGARRTIATRLAVECIMQNFEKKKLRGHFIYLCLVPQSPV